MFANNAWIKIWNVTDRGSYYEVDCSTSKNNREGNWETDFSTKFVRFVGEAYNKRPQPNEKIKILNCGVQNCYEKNGKKIYMNIPQFIVFDFERENEFGDFGEPRVSVPKSKGYVPNSYGGNVPQDFEPIDFDEGLPF